MVECCRSSPHIDVCNRHLKSSVCWSYSYKIKQSAADKGWIEICNAVESPIIVIVQDDAESSTKVLSCNLATMSRDKGLFSMTDVSFFPPANSLTAIMCAASIKVYSLFTKLGRGSKTPCHGKSSSKWGAASWHPTLYLVKRTGVRMTS